jgi:hypothetical protein
MVPGEILEDIFAHLSRDDLDCCEIICLKWRNVIETSKQLTQRRVVSFKYCPVNNGPNLWMEFISQTTGKTIRIEGDPIQQELPASRVFKNIIIDKLGRSYIYNLNRSCQFDCLDYLEEAWEKIFKLAGDRIIVKSVHVTLRQLPFQHNHSYNVILLRFHDLLSSRKI